LTVFWLRLQASIVLRNRIQSQGKLIVSELASTAARMHFLDVLRALDQGSARCPESYRPYPRYIFPTPLIPQSNPNMGIHRIHITYSRSLNPVLKQHHHFDLRRLSLSACSTTSRSSPLIATSLFMNISQARDIHLALSFWRSPSLKFLSSY
jgi:hypothetical protein